MPKITQAEIRENAQRFVHDNRDIRNEQAEAQTFWNDFFKVFGVERRKVAAFEKAVQKLGGGRGRIDVFWSGVLLVEHKSRGESLDKAALQAFDYVPNLDERDMPQYVLVSDFANFRLYDLERLEFLFDLYRQYTEPWRQTAERETRRPIRRRRQIV